MSLRLGLGLDLWRIVQRRISRNYFNVMIETVGQPIVVAIVVAFAFILRKNPANFREQLVYFSTLYAFWAGLFGSCQAINSELRNGEWCYWVLGMHRNRFTHLVAIMLSSLLFAFAQMFVFLLALMTLDLWLPSWAVGETSVFSAIVDCYVPFDRDSCNQIFIMGGMLRPLLEAYGLLWAFICGVFALSLVASVVSGVGFGILFSAAFKDSAVSLNVSVGFVVLLGILSYCGLKDPKMKNGNSTYCMEVGFAPEVARTDMKNATESTLNERRMVRIASKLPMKYCFNIGRVPFTGGLGIGVKGCLSDRMRPLREGETNGQEKAIPPWLRRSKDKKWIAPPAASTNGFLRDWCGLEWDDKNGAAVFCETGEVFRKYCLQEMDKNWRYLNARIARDYIQKYPQAATEWGFSEWKRLMGLMILEESIPLILWFALCMTGAYLIVSHKGVYNELR